MREIASVVKKLTSEIQAVEYHEDGYVTLSDAYTGEDKGRMPARALELAVDSNILSVLAYKDELPWDKS